ncbi:MAG TPA: hypothetical protein VMF91_11645 [Bryobacteraceae bacterium]|nr:hypothetical protein [Bryobacteraceae bacterium]
MRRVLTCLLGLALCHSLVLAQTVMTNATVIKMTKAGLAENIIISSIDSHPGNYAMNPDDLIALKNLGVSDKVIAAMIAKASSESSSPNSPHQTAIKNPDAANSHTQSDAGIISGVVEAEIANGDLKPARFAKIFVIPAQNADQAKSGILNLARTLEDARTAALRQEGPNGPESNIVEIQCLAGLIKIRLALTTGSINASANPETSQNLVAFDADELGQFQLKGIKSDSFIVVAVGKVGMNGAIWVSETESAGKSNEIKLSQPVLSCYDAQGVF